MKNKYDPLESKRKLQFNSFQKDVNGKNINITSGTYIKYFIGKSDRSDNFFVHFAGHTDFNKIKYIL